MAVCLYVYLGIFCRSIHSQLCSLFLNNENSGASVGSWREGAGPPRPTERISACI